MDAEKVSGLIADKVITEIKGHMPDDAIRAEFRDTIKNIAEGVLNWEIDLDKKVAGTTKENPLPPPSQQNSSGNGYPSGPRGKSLYSDFDPFPFGKHKGVEMYQVPNNYWDWMSTQSWVEKDWPGIFKYMNGESAMSTEESGAAPDAGYNPELDKGDNIPF